MKKNWIKSVCAVALATLFLGATGAAPTAATAEAPAPHTAATPGAAAASVSDKEEVVYANLSPAGAVSQVYVVNQFNVTAAGSLADHGNYTELTNLTSEAPLTAENGVVTTTADTGNFYYQGTLATTHLPWLFDITYTLNGEPVDAQAIAGRDGDVQITLTSRQNPAVDATFYDNYMLQISLTFDSNRFSDITSESATLANAGKNRIVTHTVMPGKNADITVSATVTGFSLASIEIAGMPFSMSFDIPDTGDMVGQMSTLTDAIGALNSGIGELANGVDGLNSGVGELVNGSAQFAGGLSQLSGNSAQLVDGSAQIDAALAKIAKNLKKSGSGNGIDLTEFSQLPAGLRQLADGLTQTSAGLTQLKDGYATMFATLDAALLAIPTVAETDIGALSLLVESLPEDDANKPVLQNALAQLLAAYAAGQTALGTYTYVDPATGSSIQTGMAAVTTALEGMVPGLDTMATTLTTIAQQVEDGLADMDITAQLEELADGLSTLSDEYGQFHTGLAAYMDGVAQVASGYGSLHGGLAALGDGTGKLASGAHQLHSGASQLNDEVADLPDTMQVEIDNLLSDYDTSDFTPVSFTSPKNTQTSLVQFVLMTEAITAEPTPEQTDAPEQPETFWDRLRALFGG